MRLTPHPFLLQRILFPDQWELVMVFFLQRGGGSSTKGDSVWDSDMLESLLLLVLVGPRASYLDLESSTLRCWLRKEWPYILVGGDLSKAVTGRGRMRLLRGRPLHLLLHVGSMAAFFPEPWVPLADCVLQGQGADAFWARYLMMVVPSGQRLGTA